MLIWRTLIVCLYAVLIVLCAIMLATVWVQGDVWGMVIFGSIIILATIKLVEHL